MASATVAMSPARAKAARQKKMVIAGSALLLVVLVIQGPKLMKQLHGSSPAATPAPAVPVPSVPGTPAATTPVVPTAPAATTGELTSFETFTSKDPFVAQVTDAAASSTAASGTSSPSASGGTGSSSTATASSQASSTPAGGTLSAAAGFKVAGSATTPPASPQLASASLQVNGSVTTVDEGRTFPRADPVFKLVSVSSGSVQIAIAGGSLKGGSKTVTVAAGKQLTLQNTATGKRYTIKVISTTPKG